MGRINPLVAGFIGLGGLPTIPVHVDTAADPLPGLAAPGIPGARLGY